MLRLTSRTAWLLVLFLAIAVAAPAANVLRLSTAVVPGTGLKIEEMGDDFEASDWKWHPNGPKASRNLDRRERLPGGVSENELWYESTYRGRPDLVRRVGTPLGGVFGSKGSLLIRTLHSGVPGRRTRTSQQDDLIFGGGSRFGTFIDVKHRPNFQVHVYLPPWKYWDKITDTSLGIRCDIEGRPWKTLTKKLFTNRISSQTKTYWPGFFIQFNSPDDPRYGFSEPSALIIMRADERGEDVVGPEIKRTGWWTFGMSFTPDGRVHYYASPGVDRLKSRDRIGSFFPYSCRARKFNSFFFNVISRNDAKHWSTPWVIDNPYVHVATRSSLARKSRSSRTR